MDLLNLIESYSESAVVAYVNIISKDSVSIAFSSSTCKLNCLNCHMLMAPCFSDSVIGLVNFKKYLLKQKDITCVMFIDNYYKNNSRKTNEEDLKILTSYIEVVSKLRMNICLMSSRRTVPVNLQEYITLIK